MRCGVVLVHAADLRLHAGVLGGPLEVDGLDQPDGEDEDSDGGEDKQRAVEDAELVVGNGAQGRSVEWICPRVVKADPKEVSDHIASAFMEQQARAAVRAHKGRAPRAWPRRGEGGRDRCPDGEQGAGASRRDQAGEPDVGRRYLLGPSRRPALTPRFRRQNVRPAAQRGAAAGHQRPFAYGQGAARESPQPLSDRSQIRGMRNRIRWARAGAAVALPFLVLQLAYELKLHPDAGASLTKLGVANAIALLAASAVAADFPLAGRQGRAVLVGVAIPLLLPGPIVLDQAVALNVAWTDLAAYGLFLVPNLLLLVMLGASQAVIYLLATRPSRSSRARRLW